jgi:FkbM family methyltransferase
MLRRIISRALFHGWPLPFGHVRVMNWLNPPRHPSALIQTTLRRYALRFEYDPNTYIGRFLYYRGIFEEEILRTLEKYLKNGATFIDIGANIGQHTVVAARLVGPQGKVIAFEPQSRARSMVVRNVKLNGLANVEVVPLALGQKKSSARIYSINRDNDGQATLQPGDTSCESEEVSIDTLDTFFSDRDITDCVLKLDVEGGEMDVLLGGQEFLARHRPRAIFVECIDEHLQRFRTSRNTLRRWLRDQGYEVRALRHGRWNLLAPDEAYDGDYLAVRSN